LIGSPFDVTRFLIQLLSRSASSKKATNVFQAAHCYSIFLLKRQNKTADNAGNGKERSIHTDAGRDFSISAIP
jgi:hypothetical protein